MNKLKQIPEFLRFVMVGLFCYRAALWHLFLSCKKFIQVNVAYTLGYVLSFVANFYLTAYFTFGQPPSWKKAFGFGGAHLTNYLIHIGLLNLFLRLGFSRPLAPIPVFLIAIPVNFFISEVCFQTKVISLRSLYDSEE